MSHTIKPFTTDGCSGGMSIVWKALFRELPPWENKCVIHDVRYWIGGTVRDRLNADIALRKGIIEKGHNVLGWLTFIAVRIFGSPLLPTPFRWGYGHGYAQKGTYWELSQNEKDAVDLAITKNKGE